MDAIEDAEEVVDAEIVEDAVVEDAEETENNEATANNDATMNEENEDETAEQSNRTGEFEQVPEPPPFRPNADRRFDEYVNKILLQL